MVQQIKVSVWTAAISSSASIGQPVAFNSPAVIPIIAALLRFLSEVIRQSLPEASRRRWDVGLMNLAADAAGLIVQSDLDHTVVGGSDNVRFSLGS